MNNLMKKIFVVALGMTLFFSARLTCAGDDAHVHPTGLQYLNEPAPEFFVVDRNGEKTSIKDFKGRAVLLHFWATWCAPCKDEFPAFEKLYQEFGRKGLTILAVSIDSVAGLDEVTKRAVSYGGTFPVYVARQGSVTNKYWTWGVPVTYFINKKGLIAARGIGQQDWAGEGIKRFVKELIEEK
ncbi:TlpA family protein disulfide reductase [bacterium]|nr:MAG: TlpA family protein disulfide reductase [bacterium]